MLRKLLACLALLTGLAAAGTPAQAEVAVAMAACAQANAGSCSEAGRIGKAAQPRALPSEVLSDPGATRPTMDPPAAIPSVRIGSDRARE